MKSFGTGSKLNNFEVTNLFWFKICFQIENLETNLKPELNIIQIL